MKAVALILALVVFTGRFDVALQLKAMMHIFFFLNIYSCFLFLSIIGCNGRAVHQADMSMSRLESNVNRFLEHINELNQQATGVLQNLKVPELSRELE